MKYSAGYKAKPITTTVTLYGAICNIARQRILFRYIMDFSTQELYRNAVAWAKHAGEIQLASFRKKNLGIETKSNEHDIVTFVDKSCESYLLSQIAEKYPSHAVLGEETGMHEKKSPFLWVIDPLDGTTNYSQGLPLFCVSIGLQYEGRTIIGVVYAPYLDELYTAVAGEGAYCNGKPIHVSEKCRLDRSVLCTGFPVDKDRNPDNNLDNVARILPLVRGLRRQGSAAYDLCCTAAGFLDGFWEMGLSPWDVCAGALIVNEAGGEVRSFRNDRKVAIAAGAPALLDLFFPLLANRPPQQGEHE